MLNMQLRESCGSDSRIFLLCLLLISAQPSLCYTASIMHRSSWAFSGERIKDPFFGPCSKVSRRCGVCNIQPPSLIVRLCPGFWLLYCNSTVYGVNVPLLIIMQHTGSPLCWIDATVQNMTTAASFRRISASWLRPLAYPWACWTYFWW